MKEISPELLGLTGPFSKIARAMSRHWRVRIIPTAHECSTDGEVIRIPMTADLLAPERRQALHGMLDHEVSHVAEERAAAEAGRRSALRIMEEVTNLTHQWMFNVYEDIRIETKYAAEYPGVADNLAACHRAFSELVAQRHATGEKNNFWHSMGCAIICKARGFDMPEAFKPYEELLEVVAEEVDAATHTEWPDDALALAERTVEKLREYAEEKLSGAGDKGEEGDPEGEGVGGDGKDSDDSAGGSSRVTGASGKMDSGEGAAAGATTRPKGEGEPTKAEAMDPERREMLEGARKESEASDPAELMRDEIKRGSKATKARYGVYCPDPECKTLDRWFRPTVTPADMDKYREEKQAVAQQIGALSAKQRSALQTLTRRRIRPDMEQGELDSSALYTVRLGNDRVCYDMTWGKALDTAVELLIDLSGSMCLGAVDGLTRAVYARRTAIGLAESWASLRLPFEVVGYSNTYSRTPTRITEGCDARLPFDYYIFKGWNEPLAATRGRFAHIRGYEENADGEALLAVAQRLLQQPQRRKLLVVLTDGAPACPMYLSGPGGPYTGDRYPREHLGESIRAAVKCGIEVYGFGMATDAPRAYFNRENGADWMAINDMSRMAVSVFKALRKKMFEETP